VLAKAAVCPISDRSPVGGPHFRRVGSNLFHRRRSQEINPPALAVPDARPPHGKDRSIRREAERIGAHTHRAFELQRGALLSNHGMSMKTPIDWNHSIAFSSDNRVPLRPGVGREVVGSG
jgi:hypothetical protein